MRARFKAILSVAGHRILQPGRWKVKIILCGDDLTGAGFAVSGGTFSYRREGHLPVSRWRDGLSRTFMQRILNIVVGHECSLLKSIVEGNRFIASESAQFQTESRNFRHQPAFYFARSAGRSKDVC
jgi:hypothetical protein